MSAKREVVQRFRTLTDAVGPARFARLVGVAPSTISHIRAGRYLPSLRLAARIEEASHGAIPASAWAVPPRSVNAPLALASVGRFR